MQNRYVGDIGDFGKYGLLRYLCGTRGMPSTGRPLRLAMVWCLYPDEDHNSDGKYVGYLTESAANNSGFRSCDPELYEALRKIVVSGSRCVDSIGEGGTLPEDTIYYDRVLHYPKGSTRLWRTRMHAEWIGGALAETADADIVFVDPDNGIASKPLHWRMHASKHTFVEDFREYFRRGQSLVIYHHLSRQGKAVEQIRSVAALLQTEVGLAKVPWALWYHRGSARCYFILPQDEHAHALQSRLDRLLDSSWRAHFEMVN